MKYVFGLFILLVAAWFIWAYLGRNTSLDSPADFISIIQEINPSDSLHRNVVGIQPYMEVRDYFSQEIFRQKMRLYLSSAQKKGFLKENTVVLLPEYLGTWLVLEGEKHIISEKSTLVEALTTMVFSNPLGFATAFFKTGDETDKAASAIFRMKAAEMADSYHKTFSELSKEFKTYLVAGSIILPEPSLLNGKIQINPKGPLFNVSFVFDPNGNIIGEPILKAFPIESENPFLTAGSIQKIPVFELPFAKTSILICADSWYPEAYQNTINQEAELILVPSFCTGN
jgi:predicted amidohydrolase